MDRNPHSLVKRHSRNGRVKTNSRAHEERGKKAGRKSKEQSIKKQAKVDVMGIP
jgi:hypothetical protein